MGLCNKLRSVLNGFWAKGIATSKEYESTITIGMRGTGDLAMSATANTSLLRKQRLAHVHAALRSSNPESIAKKAPRNSDRGHSEIVAN